MARRVHAARSIGASPERVWALLTDAASYAVWNPSILSIEGDMRVGTEVRLVSTVAPNRTFELRVTESSPPNRMVWSDGMPLGLFTGTRTFALDVTPAGTDFSMTEEFTGPLAGLITRMIPDMTESFDQFADGLTAAAEAAD